MIQYIYRTLYIVIALMLLGACENTTDSMLEEQQEVKVSFSATLHELQTRSYGKGSMVDMLYVGVFDSEGEQKELIRNRYTITSSTNIDFTISLAKNQRYDIVFWAQNKDCEVYDRKDMKAIKMDFDAIGNNFETVEKMDAFYATTTIDTKSTPSTHSIELIRPLAQVNVGTCGNSATKATFTITDAPTSFHPFTQEVSGPKDLTFTYNGVATTEKLLVEDVEYNYLAIGYLFAPFEGGALACKINLKESEGSETIKHTFTEVNFQSNKRTNIVGKLTN